MFTSHSSKFLNVGFSELWGFCEGMPGIPRNAELTVYMPRPLLFFYFLFLFFFIFYFTKSKTVVGVREILKSGKGIHGQKCFKKTALEEVSLPACLSYLPFWYRVVTHVVVRHCSELPLKIKTFIKSQNYLAMNWHLTAIITWQRSNIHIKFYQKLCQSFL